MSGDDNNGCLIIREAASNMTVDRSAVANLFLLTCTTVLGLTDV